MTLLNLAEARQKATHRLEALLPQSVRKSSTFELREIPSSVAIAASVRKIPDSSCRSDLRSVKASQRPPAHITCSRTPLGAKQPWPARPSPTRSQEVLGFEELLSELIATRMLHPHLGSRPVSAPLTFGVRCCTLSGEERCGRMIANPVKSTCTSSTPQLSERAGADACL